MDVPEVFAGVGIEGDEVALEITGEDEVACSGEIAGPGGGKFLVLPADFAGFWIDGADGAPIFFFCSGNVHAAEEKAAGNVLLWMREENIALLANGNIEHAGLRAIGRGHPIGGAGGTGAGANAFDFARLGLPEESIPLAQV